MGEGGVACASCDEATREPVRLAEYGDDPFCAACARLLRRRAHWWRWLRGGALDRAGDRAAAARERRG